MRVGSIGLGRIGPRHAENLFASPSTDVAAVCRSGRRDTAAALLTLTDGTLSTVIAAKYNGAGPDVRLELQGSKGTAHAKDAGRFIG